MFRGIIGNLLHSISKVLRKKTLLIGKLPEILFRFLLEINGLIVVFVVIAILGFNRNLFNNRTIVGGIIIILIIAILYDYAQQKLYKKEKISTLLPYENLNSVFVIIAGFLIFKDASILSVIIGIVVILITIGTSIDYKNIQRPKNLKMILIIQIMIATETLLTGYFLKDISDKEYFVLYQLIIVALLIVPILIKGFKKLKKTTPTFRGYQIGQASGINISFLLYLFLVAEFGVVISTLLSFLANGVTLLFGYIILKEKPSKKEIYLTIITTVLVGIGFYFK